MKKMWNYLKGKKRNLGIIAGFILKGMTIFAPNVLSLDAVQFIDNGIDIFLVGGIMDHARRKTDTGKKIDTGIKKTGKSMVDKTKNIIKK